MRYGIGSPCRALRELSASMGQGGHCCYLGGILTLMCMPTDCPSGWEQPYGWQQNQTGLPWGRGDGWSPRQLVDWIPFTQGMGALSNSSVPSVCLHRMDQPLQNPPSQHVLRLVSDLGLVLWGLAPKTWPADAAGDPSRAGQWHPCQAFDAVWK